jgi:carbon-monoxide dehydrogenase large subunit
MTSGFGRLPRKEDQRFVRGLGTYVDDVYLPGMLYGAVLRSPRPHARIVSIDTVAAEAHPKVKAVITGEMLQGRNLAWMPTLSGDRQAVLATDKVRFQGQEVAFVVAEDHYSARDALELIDVEYEPLPAVVDARRALDDGTPVIRDDRAGQADNHIFDWETGDAGRTEQVFRDAEVTVSQDMIYPRVHPAPLETCGIVADYGQVSGKLTLWATTQAPHAHRTLYAMVTGLPEHKIRVISPDIGGGFGNKVPIYPAYLCAITGSMITGRPVKWMEDRSENLMSTCFARDFHMRGELAASRDGTIRAIRVKVLADHGAFNGAAQPTKYPAGFFGVFTGSYDLEAAHCQVTGVYTNKAPGGVAYSCSFRITGAVYLVERMVDVLAFELGLDPDDVEVVHGDTDQTPFGLGTYGSRSTPVSGAATALVARKVRERTRIVAAAMLEADPDDLEWDGGGSSRWTTAGCGSTRRSSRVRCTAGSRTGSGWR